MTYETVKVPSGTLPDGRAFITERACIEDPDIRAFVNRFSNYWSWDPARMIWVSPAE